MRTVLKHLTLACAGTLLVACADLAQRIGAPENAALRTIGADDAYLLGRQEHLARRFDSAIASYRAALRAEPGHVNARNGLATLHAEQGQFAKAIVILQELTGEAAAASGPQNAYLFSNLGYAYFLDGRYEQAIAALEKACLLDPLNHRAWGHLGGALDKVGQHERAQLMHKQASALQAHDFRADYTIAQRAGIAAIDNAVKAGTAPAQEWASTEVRQAGAGMVELLRVAAPAARAMSGSALAQQALPPVPALPAPAPMPAPAPVPAPASLVQGSAPSTLEKTLQAPAKALLEIRNGNGVTGMAAALARKMGDPALRVVRLSNQKGFKVQQTRVEYQQPFREAAERLAERFGMAALVEIPSCKSTDMRLVIGRDLIRARFALRPLAKPAQVAKAGRGRTS